MTRDEVIQIINHATTAITDATGILTTAHQATTEAAESEAALGHAGIAQHYQAATEKLEESLTQVAGALTLTSEASATTAQTEGLWSAAVAVIQGANDGVEPGVASREL